MIRDLLDLSIDLVLNPQYLAGLDVQEAEGIDCIESIEQLRLRERNFVVILGFLERDTGLRRRNSP